MTAKKLKVGDPAPQFTLPDQSGNPVSLGEYEGKIIVLYFYPRDNTPHCTKEACGFRDSHPDLTALNASVLGISTDSVASHKRFASRLQLPFPILSDESGEVCEAYGVLQEKKQFGHQYIGVVRSTFLISPAGKIARIWRKVKVDGHVDEVQAAIQQLAEEI